MNCTVSDEQLEAIAMGQQIASFRHAQGVLMKHAATVLGMTVEEYARLEQGHLPLDRTRSFYKVLLNV